MKTTRVVGAGAPRYALSLAFQVRCKSTSQKPKWINEPHRRPGEPAHGSEIYAFNHFQSNRVVYSLSEVLNNNSSIEQITFVGKKSVPTALRKDHWLPLAKIVFPNTPTTRKQGLDAFRMLREYRVMHETNWDPSLKIKAKEIAHKGVFYSIEELKAMDKGFQKALIKKERKTLGALLGNQKANSVADMAAVLAKLNFMMDVDVEKEAEMRDAIEKTSAVVTESAEPKEKDLDSILLPRVAPDYDPIKVLWRDILDAEYAQSWPLGVVHGYMRSTRHASADPADLEMLRKEWENDPRKRSREGVGKDRRWIKKAEKRKVRRDPESKHKPAREVEVLEE